MSAPTVEHMTEGGALIADSGGSKLDWRMIHRTGAIEAASSLGFNAHSQPIDSLRQAVLRDLPAAWRASPKSVFFYGAGLTEGDKKNVVKTTLQELFPRSTIEVQSDLLGAARALFGDQSGVAAILGTGANCGFYDGRTVARKTPCLGWMLGDEGSGAYLGKTLALDYLHQRMPNELRAVFGKAYPWSETDFLQEVYHSVRPAKFLASLSQFIAHHLDHAYCRQLAMTAFESFYRQYALPYRIDSRPLGIRFVGSVAFHYEPLLREAAERVDRSISVESILQSPLEGLIRYHQTRHSS